MATRSNIAVVVKNEDLGKTIKFDENKLPKDRVAEGVEVMEEVTINKPVIQIYHHWDGYPEGVGQTLIDDFNDYDKALNLVLGGDVSSINGGCLAYYCAREGFVEPAQLDTPICEEEYVYKFEDGNWYFQSDEDTEWHNLKEYLDKNK
jgi:hypothetical protein